MSQKTIFSKPIIYLGLGRNKHYDVTSDNTNAPIQLFPYGLFLRFSQDAENIERLIYNFFDTSTQKSLSPYQRKILLSSQLFDKDCYINCYFKTPTIIYSFLEKFNQTYIFKESGSDIIIHKALLIARMQALMQE